MTGFSIYCEVVISNPPAEFEIKHLWTARSAALIIRAEKFIEERHKAFAGSIFL